MYSSTQKTFILIIGLFFFSKIVSAQCPITSPIYALAGNVGTTRTIRVVNTTDGSLGSVLATIPTSVANNVAAV